MKTFFEVFTPTKVIICQEHYCILFARKYFINGLIIYFDEEDDFVDNCSKEKYSNYKYNRDINFLKSCMKDVVKRCRPKMKIVIEHDGIISILPTKSFNRLMEMFK